MYRRVARMASAVVSEPAMLCFASVKFPALTGTALQLKKNLASKLFLCETVTEERADHILLDLFVWPKALLSNLLRNSRCISDPVGLQGEKAEEYEPHQLSHANFVSVGWKKISERP